MKKLLTKIACAVALAVPTFAGAVTASSQIDFTLSALPAGATSYTVDAGYAFLDMFYSNANGPDIANTVGNKLDYWFTLGSSTDKLFAGTIANSTADYYQEGLISQGGFTTLGNYKLNLEGNWNLPVGSTIDLGPDVSLGGAVVTAVPEPETYAMLLAGLMMMGTIARRRRKS